MSATLATLGKRFFMNGMADAILAGYGYPSPEAASHVMGQLEGHGPGPGGFYQRLIEAACHADPTNLARIRLGFPAHGLAVWIYKNESGGPEFLRPLADYHWERR